MNPVWKEKWLAALRGGEYKQTQGALRENDRFCCLGVLCDIVMKSPEGEGMRWIGGRLFHEGKANGGFLPTIIQKITGVTRKGDIPNNDPLSFKNDDGATFEQIADIIEKEL